MGLSNDPGWDGRTASIRIGMIQETNRWQKRERPLGEELSNGFEANELRRGEAADRGS